jgi:hypothetical protein
MLHKSVSPSGPASVPNPLPAPAKLPQANAGVGIARSVFALGGILSFIASSLTLSKQTAYHVSRHPTAEPHLQIIFTSPLDLFSRNL